MKSLGGICIIFFMVPECCTDLQLPNGEQRCIFELIVRQSLARHFLADMVQLCILAAAAGSLQGHVTQPFSRPIGTLLGAVDESKHLLRDPEH